MTEYREVCNSFTPLLNFTLLNLTKDRRLLAVVLVCRATGKCDTVYITLVHVHELIEHNLSMFDAEHRCGFYSRYFTASWSDINILIRAIDFLTECVTEICKWTALWAGA